MSLTIREALFNAESILNYSVMVDRLLKATVLLERGYPDDTDIDLLLEEYDDIEDVPDYEEE